MKTTFDGDELKITLDKGERDWVRKIRNITRELGRYHPHASAAADALTDVLKLIKDDGEFTPHKHVDRGDTSIVEGRQVDAAQPDASARRDAGKAGAR